MPSATFSMMKVFFVSNNGEDLKALLGLRWAYWYGMRIKKVIMLAALKNSMVVNNLLLSLAQSSTRFREFSKPENNFLISNLSLLMRKGYFEILIISGSLFFIISQPLELVKNWIFCAFLKGDREWGLILCEFMSGVLAAVLILAEGLLLMQMMGNSLALTFSYVAFSLIFLLTNGFFIFLEAYPSIVWGLSIVLLFFDILWTIMLSFPHALISN